jgi:ribulose-phosphate 3-epimerase
MYSFNYFFYRYRFLLLYAVFGVISLFTELLVARALISFDLPSYLSIIFSFIVGLLTAFGLNIRFNFHIAQPKRQRALLYFTLISSISFLVQYFFRQKLTSFGLPMELSRFLIAGLFFILSYLLHRKFSFKEFKKVGVAIYADGVEDIKLIYDRISNISDFIHIDIVDKSFNPTCKDVKAYRAEVVRAYWQKKKIEVHIMSKTPSVWLDDLLPYVDIIYIHAEIDEDIQAVFKTIENAGVKAGIAVGISEKLNAIFPYLDQVKHVLLLSIPKPGFSGQKFDMEILPWIDELNQHKNRQNFEICLDGGVNQTTVKYLNVESVVSGSFILSAPNPIKNIMLLQTSGEYEKY